MKVKQPRAYVQVILGSLFGLMLGFGVHQTFLMRSTSENSEPTDVLAECVRNEDNECVGCKACRFNAMAGACSSICQSNSTAPGCQTCITQTCGYTCQSCGPAGSTCKTNSDCCDPNGATVCVKSDPGNPTIGICSSPQFCCGAVGSAAPGCTMTGNNGADICSSGANYPANSCGAACTSYVLSTCDAQTGASCQVRTGSVPPGGTYNGETYYPDHATCTNACEGKYVLDCQPNAPPACNFKYFAPGTAPPNSYPDFSSCEAAKPTACSRSDLQLLSVANVYVTDGSAFLLHINVKNLSGDPASNVGVDVVFQDPPSSSSWAKLYWTPSSSCTIDSSDDKKLHCTIPGPIAVGSTWDLSVNIGAEERECSTGCNDAGNGNITATIVSANDSTTGNNTGTAQATVQCRMCCGDGKKPNILNKYPGVNDDNNQEFCDPQDSSSGECTNTCSAVVCGDGKVEGTEQCDSKTDLLCGLTQCQCLGGSTPDGAHACKCPASKVQGQDLTSNTTPRRDTCRDCGTNMHPNTAQTACVCNDPTHVYDINAGGCFPLNTSSSAPAMCCNLQVQACQPM